MRRRSFLMSTAALALASALPAAAGENDISSLVEVARALARTPYVPSPDALPPPFAGLTYDAYRAIRPIAGKAAMLPVGVDYAVDLLPPGLYFPDPVNIEFLTADGLRTVDFSPALFDFDKRYFDAIPETSPGAGFSGLRLRTYLNTPDHMDEFLVVQGASYFRAIGRDMIYGLSCRAVALGTGGPEPEEFPVIRHLRLDPPEGDMARFEAVFDSPSLSGHMDLRIRAGDDTSADVSVTIFPREDIADVGVAPLTSMYLKGALRGAVSDDFRPRVHDSDLLFVENGQGERIWRPISNPALIQTSAFGDVNPAAFGLFQTHRAFPDFQDPEARYHERPSCLVEPLGDWGQGAVMLVEIPTGDEFMDNIVAFWRPAEPLRAGGEYRFDYRVTWTVAPAPQTGAARIVESRSGREHDRPGTLRYVIDYAGDPEGLSAEVQAATGDATVTGVSLFPLPEEGLFRTTFLFTPGENEAAELRVQLLDTDGVPQNPVWLHRWTRARDGGV
jgi:periplasmic glucans biosynthesis protein